MTTETNPDTPAPTPLDGGMIHPSMIAAAKAIGAVAKNLKNIQSNYAARSIDDVLDAAHGALVEAGVMVVPRVMHRETETRTAKSGNNTYYVAVKMEYDFVAADGSKVTARVFGESLDSSDKAGNKAISAAMKMALIQTFTIPVTGDDADADSHTPETRQPAQWEALNWPDEESFAAWHETFMGRMKTLADDDVTAAWKRWRTSEGISWPIDRRSRDAADRWCAANSLGPVDEAPFTDPPAEEPPAPPAAKPSKPRAPKPAPAPADPGVGDVGFDDTPEKFSDGPTG